MAFRRKRKFRHVFGQAKKKDQCYEGIRITSTSWDSMFCAVNPKFVAVITEAAGGGAFLVLPLSKVGREAMYAPPVAGHKAAVLDVAWCPHNDNIIASASEDSTVKLWRIPDSGLEETLTEAESELCGHERRVGCIVWHPSAQGVLASAGSDMKVMVWNVATEEVMVEIPVPELVYCMSFNHNGSRLACTAKDKKLRIIETRTGNVLEEAMVHEGSKPSRVTYLKDGRLFTTGFSKRSERQLALWDETGLKELYSEDIDNSNGTVFIFYDPDTSIVYLAGKGDSTIRYYEVTEEKPYVFFLSSYSSPASQRGLGYMPKRGVNAGTCEIARFYKLHNNGLCEVIPFRVPRKSGLFRDDLFPDTASVEAAISAEEFFNGVDADPVLMSVKSGMPSTQREKPKAAKKPIILTKAKTNSPGSQSQATEVVPSGSPAGMDVMAELMEMREQIKKNETRITDLETRLTALERTAVAQP